MAEDDAFRKGLALAGRVGVELVAATVVGTGLGYLLDQWLGTGPWLLIVGVFLGATAGILAIFRMAKNL
ncbi:MAG: AtpZ/AtpI family protein [Nitrospirota bacterium]